MTNDNRNLLIAVMLSMLVLLGWTWATEKFFPTPKPAPTSQAQTPTAPQAGTPATPGAPAVAGAPATAAAPGRLRSRDTVLASTPRVRIDTPRLRGSINLKGAMIDDLVLLTHRQALDANSPPVRLLSPLGAPGSSMALTGWTGQGVPVPGFDTLWTADSTTLSPGHPVTLSYDAPNGLRYREQISVDDGYLFTIRQSVANVGTAPVTISPIALVSRAGKSPDPSTWNNHVGPIGVFNNAANYDVGYENLDGQEPGFFPKLFGNSAKPGINSFEGQASWLGFTDKYWLTALIFDNKTLGRSTFRSSGHGGYQGDYAYPAQALAPGQTATTETRFFAGAKEKAILDRYEDAGISKLSKSIDWGWFEWFMRPIFDLLQFLFHATGNFGVAIICLTLIVRAIMFPIAQKQFQSMAAMRKVQPKLKAIQQRFKDDKQRQQQEVLKLYQAEKINPAAGCLPILLQIPVFFALYKVLTISVEMRHQPFVLWINDLSAPDPLTPVNLFGLLHFTPPHMLAIGILPIVVGFTQWLTMKLSPQPMDPAQAQVFAIMPWVMIIFFAPLAAGIQLYYAVSNGITILQQWWLYRRFGLHLSDTHPVET